MNGSDSVTKNSVEDQFEIGKSIHISSPSSTVSGLSIITKYTEASIMSDNDESQQQEVETRGEDSAQLVASTSTSVTCLPKTIWNGRSIITVKDVYNKNLVEDENKDTIMAIGNVMSQTIFPKIKFLVNWDSCCVPYHDKEKDVDYLQIIFDRMGWNYRSNEQLHVQAVKWNTYRNSAKAQFNSTKATRIGLVKKEIVSGTIVLLFQFDFLHIM